MIRLLQSGARFIAASLALVAVICLVAQGALAGVAKDAPPGHWHHGHHVHFHKGHVHIHAPHAHAQDAAPTHVTSPDLGVVGDAGQDPESGAKADFDGLCCGTTCSAVILASAGMFHRDLACGRVAAATRSEPVHGVVPDGLRRPPRVPTLA